MNFGHESVRSLSNMPIP